MISYETDRASFVAGEASALARAEHLLRSISDQRNLNAFLHVDDAGTTQRAADSQERIDTGMARPLDGMVIGIKDNISVKDMPLTCASRILDGFRATYNATVIERIGNAGGNVVGKTNMDEFAMGSSNETSAYGPVLHPVNNALVPGGSSGGSAVAVAAGMCHAALGSDTGGSIRQPAAFCGVFGFKPTYGTVSRYGLTAFASSLDQIGVFATSVADTRAVFDVIRGHDPMDATSVQDPATIDHAPATLRVGVLAAHQLEGCEPSILDAYARLVERFRTDGATIVEIEIPHSDVWIPTYFILAAAEASSNLARFDGVRYGIRSTATDDFITATRTAGFGPEVKRRIMLGTYVLSSGYYDAYYAKAQQARRLIRQGYDSIFTNVDVVALPTTPTTAFERGAISDPVQMWLSDYFTVSANIAGIPAISIPYGTDGKGLPIGMQLQAPMFADGMLLEVAERVS